MWSITNLNLKSPRNPKRVNHKNPHQAIANHQIPIPAVIRRQKIKRLSPKRKRPLSPRKRTSKRRARQFPKKWKKSRKKLRRRIEAKKRGTKKGRRRRLLSSKSLKLKSHKIKRLRRKSAKNQVKNLKVVMGRKAASLLTKPNQIKRNLRSRPKSQTLKKRASPKNRRTHPHKQKSDRPEI